MEKLVSPSLVPWIKEMNEHAEQPSLKTIAILNSIMDMAFLQSQTNTHVISGRLRASGRVYTDVRRGKLPRYEGRIEYGNSMIDYAGYESARGSREPRMDFFNHPGHDNLDDLEYWVPEIDAVLKALE